MKGMMTMLVFTIDDYQKCNYCENFTDDGGLINEMFACRDCLETREDQKTKDKKIFLERKK